METVSWEGGSARKNGESAEIAAGARGRVAMGVSERLSGNWTPMSRSSSPTSLPAGRPGGTRAVGGEGERAADGEEADAGRVDFGLRKKWKKWKLGCGRAPWRAGSR